ncbi:hypothetical protein GGR50DRAFT_515997 [Xylaria sp. CBS 124048]|nr:hypothetical protein GGR50DRAFT_515997 [Xylaria sp. CBS 124048]
MTQNNHRWPGIVSSDLIVHVVCRVNYVSIIIIILVPLQRQHMEHKPNRRISNNFIFIFIFFNFSPFVIL